MPQPQPPLPPQFQPGAFGVSDPALVGTPVGGNVDWDTIINGPSSVTGPDGTEIPVQGSPLVSVGGAGKYIGALGGGKAGAATSMSGLRGGYRLPVGGWRGSGWLGKGGVKAAASEAASTAPAVASAASKSSKGGNVLKSIGGAIKSHKKLTGAAVVAGGITAGVASKSPSVPDTSALANDPINAALDQLNRTMLAAGIPDKQRANIFKELGAYKTAGTLTPEIISGYMNQIAAQVETAQAKADAESLTEITESQTNAAGASHQAAIDKAEASRQAALDEAIADLESRQSAQNAAVDARALALQNWATGVIGGVGSQGTGSLGTEALGQAMSQNMPAAMQATGAAMVSKPWETNTATGAAYRNQLAALSAFSPVLNPRLDPNFGQPYTDAISQLVMQQAMVPEYDLFDPGQYQSDMQAQQIAAMHAQAAMINAQAAIQNAGTNSQYDPATLAALEAMG